MVGVPTAAIGDTVLNREQTFEGLVHEYKNRIHGYVCRLTNDSPDAEDLTQEVFIRAYQSMHAFRHDAAMDTWLYRIATNLVIDRFRRSKRAPQTVSVSGDEDDSVRDIPSHDRSGDPHANVQLSELQRQVQKAIQSLPPKLRAVIVLHDMEGLAYEEVAQTVGCPVGTVKSRLFNARLLLRRKLQHYFDSGE